MSEPRTVKQLIATGRRVLDDSSHIFEDHDTVAESEELLAHVLRVPTDELEDDAAPPRRSRERFLALIARRAAGEPLPFLLGHITFYGLELAVRPGAFVPRPSSELMVERALRVVRRRRNPVVVDVCTGAGPIAMAIADELPDAEVWGTDISGEALKQGRDNARRLGIANVHFRRGDMYGALPARLRNSTDLITGHVPYVPPDEVEDLPAEVREHEPVYTLSDLSSDGLQLMRYAVEHAREWLKPGGWLMLEVSEDFGRTIARLCRKAGLESVEIAKDADRLSVVVESRRSRRG